MDDTKGVMIPYAALELAEARAEERLVRVERAHQRERFAFLGVIAAIVCAFFLYLYQYDFTSYLQDGDGVNTINTINTHSEKETTHGTATSDED